MLTVELSRIKLRGNEIVLETLGILHCKVATFPLICLIYLVNVTDLNLYLNLQKKIKMNYSASMVRIKNQKLKAAIKKCCLKCHSRN